MSRHSDINRPSLQAVHTDIGVFLADQLLDTMGFSDSSFSCNSPWSHVQGTTFQGRSTDGNKVLTLPLMWDGEPMSQGVHKQFPSAKLVHWVEDSPPLVDMLRLDVGVNVIIVDSVVNSGQSIKCVLHHFQSCLASTSLPQFFVLTAVMHSVAFTRLLKAIDA